MTIETLNQLGGALQRIAELNEKKIIESSDAGERRAQEAFVKDTLYANASELCGAWITIQNNYKPLVTGFTALLRTALTIINRESENANTAQPEANPPYRNDGKAGLISGEPKGDNTVTPAEPAAPDNVIPLVQPA